MYSRKTAKIVIIAAVFGTVALYSRAQDRFTYTVGYYKQIAVVVKGQKTAGDETGQFICVTGKSCYDSDKDGYTVENGALSYLGLTDGGYHNYYGGSFWGEANYYFSKDYSRLNIQLRNEEKTYVYERAAAPSGALTSAKIKAKPAPAQDSGSIVIPPVVPPAGTNTDWGTTPPLPPVDHTAELQRLQSRYNDLKMKKMQEEERLIRLSRPVDRNIASGHFATIDATRALIREYEGQMADIQRQAGRYGGSVY